MLPPAPRPTLFPYTTLFRSTVPAVVAGLALALDRFGTMPWDAVSEPAIALAEMGVPVTAELKQQLDGWAKRADADRKSTRLNSSHVSTSYAVFCLKKKKNRS